jgi:hypothetical protein
MTKNGIEKGSFERSKGAGFTWDADYLTWTDHAIIGFNESNASPKSGKGGST